MNLLQQPRMTPWVGRLIVVNAVVLLLLMTLFPALTPSLQFEPNRAFRAPWSFVTYMFVHAGLFHLAFNMLMLFFLGPPVEHRMSSHRFIRYYVFCGLGGALLSLGLASFIPIAPFIGASAAVLGVAVGFAIYWPDAELMVFPIPIPIKARTLIAGLVVLDLFFAATGSGGRVAHWAHLGGALFGYLAFRFEGVIRERPAPTPKPVERVLVLKPEQHSAEHPAPPPRAERPRPGKDPVTLEMNRVLDKISAEGITSLTPAERRFLDDIAKQKKDGLH
ncbi:MAG: rhomboid family intramembrane serine protease [Gemmatimonadales bacterium]|nr:rhomboid family intramembrane serine protease [Gemmatimonadales bacterium]